MSKEKEEKTASISIPHELYQKIQERVNRTEFDSVEEYVDYVLSEVVSESREQKSVTKGEQEKIEGRLRDLGYL